MPKLLFPVLAATLMASACSAGNDNAPAKSTAAATNSAAAAIPQTTNVDAPQAVTDAVRKLAPRAAIQSITRTPIPDLYQVIAQGQVVYVSADGRYLFQGNAYDLKTHTDLSDAQMNRLRREALASISPAQTIRFAPAHPKYTVTVFTDIDCPYCREFHRHIADYNAAGIAIDYLFWPRSGLDTPSAAKAVSVWCAADRKRAFTAAKAGVDPKPATCANPVKHDFELGLDLGVDGTPSIIASNGALIGGYATPQDLLKRLHEVHAPASGG